MIFFVSLQDDFLVELKRFLYDYEKNNVFVGACSIAVCSFVRRYD